MTSADATTPEQRQDIGQNTQPQQAREPVYFPLTHIPMPGPLANVANTIGDKVEGVRTAAIKATPGFIVNNSSNFFGAAHVWTEMIMFKSSLKGGKLVEESSNPFDYAVKAVKRVYGDAFKNAVASHGGGPKIFEGNPFKNVYRIITDTGAATEREVALQMGKGVSRAKVSLSNPWQTRSTLSSLTVWTLSALIPDKKESPDEVDRMRDMAKHHPVQYVGERLKQAVWVPGWGDHKRQMIGLGVLGSGIFSTLGAWRNRENVNGNLRYAFNKGYLMTSLITLTASLPLLFATDEKSAFGDFGTVMLGRLAFLKGSISKKLQNNEPGTNWYIGATASFQAENLGQALIGGAEKRPDGSIVDHHKDKAKAQATAAAPHTAPAFAAPTTTVAQVQEHALAMPQEQQLKMA